ncbi:peptidoglycan/LPS O-acetylase OafA/YrhL [Bradyrhizobium macuxiense]|uniref:Peptidoglycan/LPS O-acetylase OafA/YrhL n=1 Tax=Bradyrhizobium macuxiense TaxID=1755647 RepID=A0A560KVB7_9BRAD|nr:acyltransferase family protein [Bradyrhizobium macuxiense]TWB87145.1 peptidoglycan/LPS O-acetylase OafA/YrhL [Bradyrhizobium macuxiense]
MKPAYRPDIDGLRAVAVSAVILFHAFPEALPGGFVGVDIFFVISGYLITGIVRSELHDKTFSIATFYERRIRRIFPALIIVLMATEFAGLHLLPPDELHSLGKNAVASALFSANLMLLSEVNYFDISAHSKPLLHLWSLGIEEQFYLLWPLILWALPHRKMPVAVGIALIASFALNLTLVRDYQAATFYLPFTRAWELMAGALLTFLPSQPRAIREPAAIVGLVAIEASFFLFTDKMTFPGWAAALPVTGALLVIMSERAFVNRFLSLRLFVGVGLVSYSLYLWHWPVLVFLQVYLFRPLNDTLGLVAIVLTSALSVLTFFAVERPLRRRATILPTGAAMAAAGLFGLYAAVAKAPDLPDELQAMISAPDGVSTWRVHECILLDGEDGDFRNCSESKRPLIAIWGDSTASALVPGFRKLQQDREFGFAQLSVSSCHPLLVPAHSASEYCLKKNSEIVRRISEIKPDVVVLHAIWDVNDRIGTTRPTIDALRAAGVPRIIILGPVPVWRGGLPNAAVDYFRRSGEIIPERISQFVDGDAGDKAMSAIAAELGVQYVSARNALCLGNKCLTHVNGAIMARDIIHLTKAGSEFLIGQIAPQLGIE